MGPIRGRRRGGVRLIDAPALRARACDPPAPRALASARDRMAAGGSGSAGLRTGTPDGRMQLPEPSRGDPRRRNTRPRERSFGLPPGWRAESAPELGRLARRPGPLVVARLCTVG